MPRHVDSPTGLSLLKLVYIIKIADKAHSCLCYQETPQPTEKHFANTLQVLFHRDAQMIVTVRL